MLGFDHVLTSGRAHLAPEGGMLIAGLIGREQGCIEFLSGGDVWADDVTVLLDATGVGTVHVSCRHRNQAPELFGFASPPGLQRVDPNLLAALRQTTQDRIGEPA